ncbi:MAG: hypothetical protein ACLRVN_06395 [Butyricicoccus sp.]
MRAIGVSTRPARWKARMPCFLAGEASRGRGAFAFRAAFTVSHQRGHIAAALSAGKLDLLDGEFWRGTCPAARVSCCM